MTQALFWNLKTAQEEPGAFGDLSLQGLQGLKQVEGLKEPRRKPKVKIGNTQMEQMIAAQERSEQQAALRRYVDEQQTRIGL